MTASIVSNNTAATFGNSPQKTGEPLDHAKLYTGKGLEFDGVSDYLDTNFEVSADANATPNVDHTIAIWAKMNVGGAYMALFTSRKTAGSSNVGTGLEIKSNDKARIGVQDGTSHAQAEGTTNFADLQWHRVVGVCDRTAGTIKIYVDGALEGTTSSVAAGDTSYYNNREMGIGVYDVTLVAGLSGYFNGLLCDAQLWHKCWSEDDVRYDYLNPEKLITDNASVTAGITTSDLKLWYPMNDTGHRRGQTVVFDAAGTNNTTKNHATTIFYGDMTDLIADDASNGANLYNTANTKYDFTTESTASGTDTYDVLGNSHWTGTNATAAITTGESDTGMEIKNTGASVGSIRSGAITTVSGRTYQLDITHTPTSESHVDVDLGVYAGTSAGGSQYINISNQSDGSYSGTFVATGAELHLTLAVISSLINKVVRVRTLQLREVGIASGWTDADQQQTIPQTALMSGSVKSFVGNGLYSNSIPSLSYPFTLSCWLYKTDDAAYGVYLVDKDASNIYFGIALGADDKVYLQASNTTNKNTNSNSTYTNQWVHIVASFESATDRNLYINGSPNTDNENNDSVTYSNIDRISVGYMGDSSPTYSGSEIIVDEVCVFSTGLNDSEALELYNSGAPLNATNHSLGTTNLVGYWRNNDLHTDGKWKDQISTNHLTANDSPSTIFFQEGVTANLDTQGFNTNIDHTGSKGAVYFDGIADYIDLGKTTTIEGEFTLEFWLKTDNPGTTENYIMGLNSNDFIFIDDNNTIKLEMNGSTETLDINDVGYHATDTLLVNEWVHIAITRNSDNVIKLYVNSQVQTDTSTTADNFDFRYIGFDGDSNYFKGWLDEFKVYDKELTSGLVGKNYKHGKSKHKNS